MTTPLSLRRVFFRIMLWSLGAAAIAGFFAVLAASYDVVGRVAATAFATALASGIMWRLEALLDNRDKAVSGLLGMSSTGICFLLALFGIWAEGSEWRWWVSVWAFGMTTPAAMGCLQLTARQRTRLAGWVGLSISCLLLVVWLIAAWLVTHNSHRWFETVYVLAGYGALISLCLIGVSRSVRWRWAGVACAALGAILNLQIVWHPTTFSEPMIRVITVLASVAIVISHANLSLLVTLRPSQGWIRWGTVASAILTAGCIDTIILFEWYGDNLVARLAAGTAIVTGCGSLALVILARYNQFATSPFAGKEITVNSKTFETMTIVCPRCGLQQPISLGKASCKKCSLTISISLEADGVLER